MRNVHRLEKCHRWARALCVRPPAVGAAIMAALVAGAAVLCAVPAAAAPAGDVPQHPGTGMAISPPRLVVPAGQVTKVQRLEIENRGSVPLHLHVELSAFEEASDVSTVLRASAPYSAVRWIKVVPGNLLIMPGTKRFVQVRIHVPARAEPGDHYVEIIFMAPPVAGRGNIHIAEGLGVPVLITVPGPVIDNVRVTRLTADRFSAGGAVLITATLHESGDVHHSFRGAGERLTAVADGSRLLFPPFTVLRGTTVSVSTRWDNPPTVCVCHITVSVVTDGHRSDASVTVVIFPVAKAIGGAAALTGLSLAFLFASRRMRSRGRRGGQARWGRAASLPPAKASALLYHESRRSRPPALSRSATHAGSGDEDKGHRLARFPWKFISRRPGGVRGAWPKGHRVTRDHARKQAIRARMAATGEPYSVAARALDAAAPVAPGPVAAESAPNPEPAADAEFAATPESLADAGAPADAERVADSAGALAAVIACASRTLTAPSARIEIRADTDLGRDPVPALRRPLRRRPGLLGRLNRRAAKAALGRVAPGTDPAEYGDLFLHQFGAGFIDLAGGRYLIDYGGWAQALVDGRRFSGLSGEPLGPRYENRPGRSRRDDPLDALGRLRSATAARWVGGDRVRWTTCRVAATTVGQAEYTVWIDGTRIQRFQAVERGSGRSARATKTETVELWDFGVPVDSLDWSRLPNFRTPR